MTEPDLEQRGINVIRGLAMDAPQKANSGHPGTAMALAPLAHVLWTRIMRYDPHAPDWPDRDRFVLSAGHASILLYSMLYLTGYGLDPRRPRGRSASGARARPGHPEVHHTAGVEVTTGPLGQGFANAVGMAHRRALAAGPLRRRAVRPPHLRDLPATATSRRASATRPRRSPATSASAGSSYVYDDNHITIDGPTELALHRRRRASASRPTAGTSSASARSPTTSTPSRRPSARAMARRGPARR